MSAKATLDAARTLRVALQQFLGDHGVNAAAVPDIQVAAGEALNNAIEHAYGAAAGLVHLGGWYEGSTLVVEVRDDGRWRAERRERRGGHGIKIMRALASRVELTTTEAGTVVRMEFSDASCAAEDRRAP